MICIYDYDTITIRHTLEKGGVKALKVSYKKLWKLLIDKELTQADLHKKSGISSGSMTKLRKSQPVSMDVLWKICSCLTCNIGDIVDFELDTEK